MCLNVGKGTCGSTSSNSKGPNLNEYMGVEKYLGIFLIFVQVFFWSLGKEKRSVPFSVEEKCLIR